MKIKLPLVKLLSLLVIVILFSSCSTTIHFTYSTEYTENIEKKINNENKIHLTIKDLRTDPEIIGCQYAMIGYKARNIKPKDPNISKAILTKYKEGLIKTGYIFTENIDNSDMTLILSITNLFAETRQGFSKITIKADCCINVALSTKNNDTVLYTTEICGNGEVAKATGFIKNVQEALFLSVDDVLSKLINDEGLINSVNTNK